MSDTLSGTTTRRRFFFRRKQTIFSGKRERAAVETPRPHDYHRYQYYQGPCRAPPSTCPLRCRKHVYGTTDIRRHYFVVMTSYYDIVNYDTVLIMISLKFILSCILVNVQKVSSR